MKLIKKHGHKKNITRNKMLKDNKIIKNKS